MVEDLADGVRISNIAYQPQHRAFAIDPAGRFARMSFIGSPGDSAITRFDLGIRQKLSQAN